ncbi:MAG: Dyp-type peroxidase, partial [Halothiobacillaceae bacterium]
GYEDGTENPQGDEALKVAIVQGAGAGLDGASFVAVQQWRHDFDRFDAMSDDEQDEAIGRRKSDNEELLEAPPSAHVKRTAQESFEPAAFMVRRSMPWVEGNDAGLNFVAFATSLDPFEVMLRRMVGQEDGVVDALFGFTRPISGGHYWCPPMKGGQLDLRALVS